MSRRHAMINYIPSDSEVEEAEPHEQNLAEEIFPGQGDHGAGSDIVNLLTSGGEQIEWERRIATRDSSFLVRLQRSYDLGTRKSRDIDSQIQALTRKKKVVDKAVNILDHLEGVRKAKAPEKVGDLQPNMIPLLMAKVDCGWGRGCTALGIMDQFNVGGFEDIQNFQDGVAQIFAEQLHVRGLIHTPYAIKQMKPHIQQLKKEGILNEHYPEDRILYSKGYPDHEHKLNVSIYMMVDLPKSELPKLDFLPQKLSATSARSAPALSDGTASARQVGASMPSPSSASARAIRPGAPSNLDTIQELPEEMPNDEEAASKNTFQQGSNLVPPPVFPHTNSNSRVPPSPSASQPSTRGGGATSPFTGGSAFGGTAPMSSPGSGIGSANNNNARFRFTGPTNNNNGTGTNIDYGFPSGNSLRFGGTRQESKEEVTERVKTPSSKKRKL